MTPQQAMVLIEALFAWEGSGEQGGQQSNAHFIIAMRAVDPSLCIDVYSYGPHVPVIEHVGYMQTELESRRKLYNFLQDWAFALKASLPRVWSSSVSEEKKP
jgi:hypothetical protein